MKEIDLGQLKEQQVSMEQFDSKQKLYTISFYIAVFISITIVMLEGTQVVEINLIDIWLGFFLATLPVFFFSLNILIYIMPLIPTKRIKKGKIFVVDYYSIIKEQTKPTLLKYKVRKVFLVCLFILGTLTAIGNITIFVIEIFL